jgi:hypothetical protein
MAVIVHLEIVSDAMWLFVARIVTNLLLRLTFDAQETWPRVCAYGKRG